VKRLTVHKETKDTNPSVWRQKGFRRWTSSR